MEDFKMKTQEELRAVTAIGRLETYLDGGDEAAPDKPVGFRLCTDEPGEAIFTIYLGETEIGHHQAINIPRAEIERVLSANPKK